MPLFSIITINYNNREGLEKTVESVLSQTSKQFEYIVIDGGSDDGSKEFIQSKSDRITYWVSEKDRGIYHAMNKGIAAATGTYCLFLNSGDSLANPQVLDKVETTGLSTEILYGEVVFDRGAGNQKIAPVPEKPNLEYLFGDNIWHPSTFIKRSLFDEYGSYNETYSVAADYDFFFHVLAIKEVSSVPLHFPVSIHVVDGVSSRPENMDRIRQERERIHKAYLSQAMIDSLNKLTVLNRSGAVKFGRWLENKPLLKRAASFFFRFHA